MELNQLNYLFTKIIHKNLKSHIFVKSSFLPFHDFFVLMHKVLPGHYQDLAVKVKSDSVVPSEICLGSHLSGTNPYFDSKVVIMIIDKL